MAVLLHYLWLTFGSSLHNRVASTNTNGQPESFCGITAAEDRLVDNGGSGQSFDHCRFTGLSYKLENYQELAIRRWITTAREHQLKGAGQGLRRGHSIGTQGLKRLTQLSVLTGPDVGRDVFSVEQDSALPGAESLAGIPEGGKPREQPASVGETSSCRGVPQGGVLEHPGQPMSPGCEHAEAPLPGPLPLQHHGPSRHQVTRATTRAGNATQSIKKRNDNDCIHLVEIATDSTLSQLRKLGLYTEGFLTDIAHQTDEAESVVEYSCAATNVQMYSAGEETEVFPKTFEEARMIGSHWVYKINAENSIGQQSLVPTALEHPSLSRRGTAISAPEKSTLGNEPMSMGMPNIDDRDLGHRVDDGKRSSGTDGIKNGAMDHQKGGGDEGDPQEGELRSGQRRDEVRRKFDSTILFVSFSISSIRPVVWNPPSDEKMVEESTLHVDCTNCSLPDI